MKKIIAMLLLSALVLGICGCAQTQPETPESSYVEGQLNVGYCMLDITPKESTPICVR